MPKGTTSPRRLSRVRQPPLPSHSSTSASSHTSSIRQERSTRSHNKASSPQKSSTPQSLTSEEASAMEESRNHQLRRSKRTHDNEQDDDGDAKIEDVEDEIVEDEETTRCICGYLEYPGPPVDDSLGRSAKGSQPPTSANDESGDDRGGLFIQCDDCQVWQHGGCVSLMEESEVPDNYYCEECKPDLHELLKSPNGQKFSHYLPVWSKTHPKSVRKGSVDKDDRKTQKDRERLSRASALPETKRRSTMNSRAAYDEDEVLRKVLEESKTEGHGSTENGSRKGKRNRDESEEIRMGIKRQRTASSVLSSHSGDDSAGESDQDKQNGGIKKPPRQAVSASKATNSNSSIKTEKASNTAATQAETTVVKRRGGRRNGGDAGEQRDSSNGAGASASATWTCHCGLWTCLCGPSLTRGDTVADNSAHNSRQNRDKDEASEAAEDESVAPSTARQSAKASPVAEGDVPDTPTLAAMGKKGGKKGVNGRGRSNPAPTPVDDKDTPRNGNHESSAQEGDSTPVPTVTLNGISKRGKRGHHLQKDQQESGDSDKDPHTTAAVSDAEPPTTTDASNLSHAVHSNNLVKKKEPSMNELKRRAAAMLDWVERAKEDLGRSTFVSASMSMSPSSGSLSPPNASGLHISGLGGPVGGTGELGSTAELLHERLLSWQVEYGAG